MRSWSELEVLSEILAGPETTGTLALVLDGSAVNEFAGESLGGVLESS